MNTIESIVDFNLFEKFTMCILLLKDCYTIVKIPLVNISLKFHYNIYLLLNTKRCKGGWHIIHQIVCGSDCFYFKYKYC